MFQTINAFPFLAIIFAILAAYFPQWFLAFIRLDISAIGVHHVAEILFHTFSNSPLLIS